LETANYFVLQPLEVVHNYYELLQITILDVASRLCKNVSILWNFTLFIDLNQLNWCMNFTMKCCRLPTLFKDLFQKTADIHCHDARCATKQNHFLQQVSTKAGKKNSFLSRNYSLGKSRTHSKI